MIVGMGTDIIEISRIQKAITNNDRFLSRVFTENEIRYAVTQDKIRFRSLAGMWAAKEAYAKATGKGFREFAMKDVEVLHDQFSAPYLKLHRQALIYSAEAKVHISISHSEDFAIAYCIIERKG
ncbi:MAG: holo-ACP synthase [Peptostreptococcaceae bacterium]|nr:holo-ACP synthase [Peptostreptococcaceae bacterium]